VVKPAEDRPSNDFAEPLDRTRMWRILCQSEMRSDLVVVAGIGLQDPGQVGFTQDHDDPGIPCGRANQSLRMAVLLRCLWCNRVIPDAHRRQTPSNGMTIGAVAIAYEMVRRFVPGKGLGNLLRDPLPLWGDR